ncbi:MAG TPA: N-acetyl-gamma-glutamyl-phosphate reductase [Jatrophihabitans sp.]|jgi:N-acetyl-gamma-glutamyl-phosphate/LysW-gamma-L-alpha-aminoadipyl-6-phosphate reductase|uniref:N-acetyl-gamma-glutamyl-phosphate reductase n=1 Tax=Jatrophihabitans sp. TaxID=1932789 RepID=UPI002F1325BC
MIRAAIVGGSGYIGGELLRLLSSHPHVEVVACTSRRLAGRRVDGAHPNLRGSTELSFVDDRELDSYDVVLLATPHGVSVERRAEFEALAPVTVNLSADFRLADPAAYRRHYGKAHADPDALGSYVVGLAELHRDALAGADRISIPGCMATAAILALHPLVQAGLITGSVQVDARTGSSGSGASTAAGNSHPERSGSMRVFAPTEHRHQAEVEQAIGLPVRMSATGVNAVRGVQVLCHCVLADGVTEAQVRQAYRASYAAEPFIRLVAHRRGWYRYPEPKLLSGSNYCDVGFALDREGGRLVAIAALDNLVKGGAGNAVQSLNVRYGWPEQAGLGFTGLHPS